MLWHNLIIYKSIFVFLMNRESLLLGEMFELPWFSKWHSCVLDTNISCQLNPSDGSFWWSPTQQTIRRFRLCPKRLMIKASGDTGQVSQCVKKSQRLIVICSRYLMNPYARIWVNFILFRVSYRKLTIEWKHKCFCKMSIFLVPHSFPSSKKMDNHSLHPMYMCMYMYMYVCSENSVSFFWKETQIPKVMDTASSLSTIPWES